MIRGFEDERLQSALKQRWNEYNYAVGWGSAEWERLHFDDMLNDVRVKVGDEWRKLTPYEKWQIYCDVFNIGEDKRHLYRKYYGLPELPLAGVTVRGPFSFEFYTELEPSDIADYISKVLRKALEQIGANVINVNLELFEMWDPTNDG
jgi:hypothetical protein